MLKSLLMEEGAFANFSKRSAGLEYLLNFMPFDKKKEGISEVRPL